MLVLILREADIYLDENNIIEFNSNNRRDIIVGIRVIGIRGAGSCPGKKNMHARTNPRIHLCASKNIFASPFMYQEGLYVGSGNPE
jgi:hypothetical protein